MSVCRYRISMASTITTLHDLKAAEVVLEGLSRFHRPVSESDSLPGSRVDSPTQLGEATEVSEGTEKGYLSDIEAAEPPQKKAREVKQEEINPAKKKPRVLPRALLCAQAKKKPAQPKVKPGRPSRKSLYPGLQAGPKPA